LQNTVYRWWLTGTDILKIKVFSIKGKSPPLIPKLAVFISAFFSIALNFAISASCHGKNNF
jgi:hypothetical protein